MQVRGDLSRRDALRRVGIAGLAAGFVAAGGIGGMSAQDSASPVAGMDGTPELAGVTHRTVPSNGIEVHIAEAGDGPLVLLVHGYPELWFSWRHQLAALAEAGYHAVAPDQVGIGGTEAPEAVERYSVLRLVEDAIGVLDALEVERAALVGHDWGRRLRGAAPSSTRSASRWWRG